MIGCDCSETQLNTVGCECHEVVVAYWPKGYADEAGLSYATMSHHADFLAEVVKLSGSSFASIFSVQEKTARKSVETYSPEYIREMSKGG